MAVTHKVKLSARDQKILIFLCWLTYTLAYLCRYSYNSNIASVTETFGVTNASAGLVATAFFFAYGAGQFINAALCKYYPKRIIVTVALLISAVINITVYLGCPFSAIKYLWFVNGLAQSVLWPTLFLLISLSVDSERFKSAILVMSTTVAGGTFLSYGTSSLFAFLSKFTLSFLLGALACTVCAVIWFIFLPRGTVTNEAKEEDEKINERTRCDVFIIICLLAFICVIGNLVKDGLQTWVPSILKDKYSLSNALAILLTLALPLLGIFGAALALKLNKKIKDYVLLCSFFFSLVLLSSLSVLGLFSLSYKLVAIPAVLIFGLTVCLMQGINNVATGMMPLYYRDKINSGFVSGMLNGFCYVGSTFSSYLLGYVSDKYGWNGAIFVIISVSATGALLAPIYMLLRRKKEI